MHPGLGLTNGYFDGANREFRERITGKGFCL